MKFKIIVEKKEEKINIKTIEEHKNAKQNPINGITNYQETV